MTMNYLIRLAQVHESFRRPELEALAKQEAIDIEIVDYQPDSPFCIVKFHDRPDCVESIDDVARSFISRSILARGIYEVWGQGISYDLLHEDVRAQSSDHWLKYKQSSFKFSVDSFCAKRSATQQKEIINSFRYLGFEGKISMKDPDVEFVVFEEWQEPKPFSRDTASTQELEEVGQSQKRQPKRLFLGRFVGGTRRQLIEKHDLKKRPYISTTSMDAELALLTANLALAAPGKIFLDPFVGTGGFMIAASELGALTFGSDIDGRSYRGNGIGLEKGIAANFAKYGLPSFFGDCFTSDLTNTPLRYQGAKGGRANRWLDGIISDPPYGVREGLKVLGMRHDKPSSVSNAIDGEENVGSDAHSSARQPYCIDGVPAYLLPGYIAPKRPYSFMKMLDHVLDFAVRSLVDGGRLAFWMPSANEADQELALPEHPYLKLKHVCVQSFNKWSRRLLVYERVNGDLVEGSDIAPGNAVGDASTGWRADDLNPFRKMYFKGFQS